MTNYQDVEKSVDSTNLDALLSEYEASSTSGSEGSATTAMFAGQTSDEMVATASEMFGESTEDIQRFLDSHGEYEADAQASALSITFSIVFHC